MSPRDHIPPGQRVATAVLILLLLLILSTVAGLVQWWRG